MKIFSLELRNFRQYKGDKRIEFGTSDGSVTIIQGDNGVGKTNLLNAITWCLYGIEKHLSKISQEQFINPMNKRAIDQTNIDGLVEMKVKIWLGDSIPEYVIQRTRRGYKMSENHVNYDPKDEFQVLWLANERDMKPVSSQPNYFVNMLLPESIHDFFFFDGEKLDDFFKADSKKNVRDSILNVAQIGLIDNALAHLDSVSDDIRRDSKGLSYNAEDISSKIDGVQKANNMIDEDLKKLEANESSVHTEIARIETKLRESPVEKAKELQSERDRLKRQEEEFQEKLDKMIDESIKHLVSKAPLVYAQQAIRKTAQLIDEKYKKGDLPAKIKEPFLKEILSSNECICGTDISPNTPTRAKVERLLKVAKFSRIEEVVNNGKFSINNMLNQIGKFDDERLDLGREISKVERQIRYSQESQKEISTQLDKIDIEEVARLEAERKKLDKRRSELLIQIGEKRNDRKNAGNYIKQLRTEYDKEITKRDRYSNLMKKLSLCDKSYGILKQIKDQLVGQVRTTIEKKTQEYFLNLIWKKETFVNVLIDENYNISVIHEGGWDALSVLSAGERQVLALSFMAALREAAGVDAPLIIDTPLGRISGEPKENIAELLPRYLHRTQVILFVTDQEYTPQVRNKLSKYIEKEYQLIFDEKNQETIVMPYVK